ncbi:MAG: hypothetical protein GXO26_09825 [Crenarchaeota archaeon]|nr:hypothetical protein [Thermoproteota archaeon]
MREKEIVEKLKKENLTPAELYGLYLALLQIRFIALTYDIESSNIESELDSMLMKQVFYRHFEESTGKILERVYDILIRIFIENPRLRKHEYRNIFIETFEQEFLDLIRDVGLHCIRPWLVPDPWKDIIVTVLDRVRKREYVISDQTLSGSVSIWEGELVKDVHTIQNLTLLEKYMLISNICTFGYNVYLVLPFYIQDETTINLIKLSKDRTIVEPVKRGEILEKLEKIIYKIQPQAKVELKDNSMRIQLKDNLRNVSITIVDTSNIEDVKKIMDKYNRDILIILYEDNENIPKLLETMNNIFIVRVSEQDARTSLLKTLDLISRLVR